MCQYYKDNSDCDHELNLYKENKLNHMTYRMKGYVRSAGGRGNLRPLSLEVF